MDDERLKQGKQVFGKDYFDELLERIREIRAGERRFYQKITDIHALPVDYSRDAPLTSVPHAAAAGFFRGSVALMMTLTDFWLKPL